MLNTAEEQLLITLLLDFGELMLASGAEINRIEDTLDRISTSYHIKKTNVFCVTSSIVLTLITEDDRAITESRRISSIGGTDFSMLEDLNSLSRRICSEHPTVENFREQLSIIRQEKRNISVLYIGSILGAGAFTIFFGGSIADAIVAALFGLLICYLQENVTQHFPNRIIFNLTVSFIIGLAICITEKVFPILNVDMIMIGDIMLLIPGIAITNAVRDMLVGDTISGSMRLIESILWAGALACGFMASIWIMRL